MYIIRIIGGDKHSIFTCMLIMIITYLCNTALLLPEKLCTPNMGRKRIWTTRTVITEWRTLYTTTISKISTCFKMFQKACKVSLCLTFTTITKAKNNAIQKNHNFVCMTLQTSAFVVNFFCIIADATCVNRHKLHNVPF